MKKRTGDPWIAASDYGGATAAIHSEFDCSKHRPGAGILPEGAPGT